jgi:hypothetical protein
MQAKLYPTTTRPHGWRKRIQSGEGSRSKETRQGCKLHYLIKWKGYPTSDNSWEPAENVQAKELIKEYKEEQRKQNKERQ